jgi:hypothetical protein
MVWSVSDGNLAPLGDYHYNSAITAAEIFDVVRRNSPTVPIVLLSELFDLPPEMIERATAFVRKGDAQRLVDRLTELRETGRVEQRF